MNKIITDNKIKYIEEKIIRDLKNDNIHIKNMSYNFKSLKFNLYEPIDGYTFSFNLIFDKKIFKFVFEYDCELCYDGADGYCDTHNIYIQYNKKKIKLYGGGKRSYGSYGSSISLSDILDDGLYDGLEDESENESENELGGEKSRKIFNMDMDSLTGYCVSIQKIIEKYTPILFSILYLNNIVAQ